MVKTKLQFTCPECGVHELNEMTNVLRVFPVVKIGEEELEYGEPVDGNGMFDAIDHYACANTACDFIIHLKTVEQMIGWLKDKQYFPDK